MDVMGVYNFFVLWVESEWKQFNVGFALSTLCSFVDGEANVARLDKFASAQVKLALLDEAELHLVLLLLLIEVDKHTFEGVQHVITDILGFVN